MTFVWVTTSELEGVEYIYSYFLVFYVSKTLCYAYRTYAVHINTFLFLLIITEVDICLAQTQDSSLSLLTVTTRTEFVFPKIQVILNSKLV
jgi:uncharacterized membrane protein